MVTMTMTMRRYRIAPLLLLLTLSAACHKSATTNTPLPPGAVNQLDATAFRVLSDAQAAINSLKADIESGKLTVTATQKAVLNQVIAHYNAAEGLAQSYHTTGGLNDPAALTAAISQLVQDIAALTQQAQQLHTGVRTTGGVK
jgi:hypothetical protein